MAKERKNYWPQAVVGILIAIFVLIGWTIAKTAEMPVHEENSYMSKYQSVDLQSDRLVNQSKAFLKEYDIRIVSEHENVLMQKDMYKKRNRYTNIIDPNKPIKLQVVTTGGEVVEDAKLEVLLSRPTTRTSDMMVEHISKEDGTFTLGKLNIDKKGRWQLICKAQVGQKTGYKNIDLTVQ